MPILLKKYILLSMEFIFFILFISVSVLFIVILTQTVPLVSPHLVCTIEGKTKAPTARGYVPHTPQQYGETICVSQEFRIFRNPTKSNLMEEN